MLCQCSYKVAICSRGKILYMRIYLIIDLKLLWRVVLGRFLLYFFLQFTGEWASWSLLSLFCQWGNVHFLVSTGTHMGRRSADVRRGLKPPQAFDQGIPHRSADSLVQCPCVVPQAVPLHWVHPNHLSPLKNCHHLQSQNQSHRPSCRVVSTPPRSSVHVECTWFHGA